MAGMNNLKKTKGEEMIFLFSILWCFRFLYVLFFEILKDKI